MAAKIQIRRDTAANWTSVNPILSIGEQGYETDTNKMKIGDGVSDWETLSYFTGEGIIPKSKYDATTAPAVGNDNTEGYAVGSRWIDVTNDNIYDCVDVTTGAAIWVKSNFEVFSFALSDYATALTTGAKDAVNIPYNSTLVNLFIAVTDAPTGANLIVDLQKNGTSMFSTKISIDTTEKTSLTAATPYTLTGTISFTKGDEVTGHIDQIGATNAGKALKVYLILDRR